MNVDLTGHFNVMRLSIPHLKKFNAGSIIIMSSQAMLKAEGKTLDEERTNMLSIQSLKRFVDPKDIAALCVFLPSDADKSISGQVFPSIMMRSKLPNSKLKENYGKHITR